MSTNYSNARDVLPPELLATLQRFHAGHLWVPPDRDVREERDELIRELYAQGVPVPEIAARVSLCERRVWQLVKQSTAISVE